MRSLAVVFVVVVVTAAGVSAQIRQPINLKVLPPGTDARTVITMMRGFTSALGVRCQHCHVYTGENPDDLSTFDFASDARPTKETSRTMMRAVTAINTDLLKGVGTPSPAGELKVTCYTCHHGATRPLTQRPPA